MNSMTIILVPLYVAAAFAVFLYGGFFYTYFAQPNAFTRWYTRYFIIPEDDYFAPKLR